MFTLFKGPQDTLSLDLLLEAAQRRLKRFVFFDFDFRHVNHPLSKNDYCHNVNTGAQTASGPSLHALQYINATNIALLPDSVN